MNAADIISAVLLEEGDRFTDRPDDRGGPTKFGITLATLTRFYAPLEVTVETLKALNEGTARVIYTSEFFQEPGFAAITDEPLAALCIDSAVQHGVPEAVEMLQRAAGVAADGRLGPVSLAAINAADARALRALVCGARIRLYAGLIERDPALALVRAKGFALQADNALGWGNRIARFVEEIT